MALYEIFNRAEGVIWFCLSAVLPFLVSSVSLVQRRAVFIASFGFLLFGISDFLEAPTHGNMPIWLWALKIGSASLLLACRISYVGRKNFRFTDRYLIFAMICLMATVGLMVLDRD